MPTDAAYGSHLEHPFFPAKSFARLRDVNERPGTKREKGIRVHVYVRLRVVPRELACKQALENASTGAAPLPCIRTTGPLMSLHIQLVKGSIVCDNYLSLIHI